MKFRMSEKEKEAELAQKKRLTGGARTQLTRLLRKVNPLMDADGVGQDKKCLKQFILQIEEYVERLKTLDTDILELISAFDDSEDLCAKDMDESEHYQAKANITVLSLEEILEQRKRPTATMTIRSSPLRRSESRETLDGGCKMRAKLPKLGDVLLRVALSGCLGFDLSFCNKMSTSASFITHRVVAPGPKGRKYAFDFRGMQGRKLP